jgi:hypothetical protein
VTETLLFLGVGHNRINVKFSNSSGDRIVNKYQTSTGFMVSIMISPRVALQKDRVSIPDGVRDYVLHYRFQTASRTHTISCAIGTGGGGVSQAVVL